MHLTVSRTSESKTKSSRNADLDSFLERLMPVFLSQIPFYRGFGKPARSPDQLVNLWRFPMLTVISFEMSKCCKILLYELRLLHNLLI